MTPTIGTRIQTRIDDCDTDPEGNERAIPAGTLGTLVGIDGPEQHHIQWDNGGWTIWSVTELQRDAEVIYQPTAEELQEDVEEADETVLGQDDGRRVFPCVHGHSNCALTEGGRCCDEQWQGVFADVQARRQRGHCCSCPHETYLTTSVSKHEHLCSSCGQTFVDTRREKRYFGEGAAMTVEVIMRTQTHADHVRYVVERNGQILWHREVRFGHGADKLHRPGGPAFIEAAREQAKQAARAAQEAV